jgi:hypothetical protein
MASTFQCSPALHRQAGDTCLPPESIERLRRAWNKHHPRNPIKLTATRKKGRVSGQSAGWVKYQSWNALRKKLKTHYKCETEYCAVKKLEGLDADERSSMMKFFRPEKPAAWDKKPTLWLDSFNIEDVMIQYEEATPEFEFIGPVPIDFDKKLSWGQCVVNELCKLDCAHMEKMGKKKLGIVFNLDPHDQPGSHWVCAFVDLEADAAYYFDSYGYEPPEEIARFLRRCKQQGVKHVYWNDIRHQRKGSECGMYCLFVSICLLHGRPFYDICKKVVDDDTMNAFRDILYAEEKPRRDAIEKALPRLCTPQDTSSAEKIEPVSN